MIPNGGVVAGDIILSVDGKRVTGVEGLIELLADHSIGDSVQLLIYRDGQTMAVSAVLAGRGRAAGGAARTSAFPQT